MFSLRRRWSVIWPADQEFGAGEKSACSCVRSRISSIVRSRTARNFAAAAVHSCPGGGAGATRSWTIREIAPSSARAAEAIEKVSLMMNSRLLPLQGPVLENACYSSFTVEGREELSERTGCGRGNAVVPEFGIGRG